jgi:hypothetical protein
VSVIEVAQVFKGLESQPVRFIDYHQRTSVMGNPKRLGPVRCPVDRETGVAPSFRILKSMPSLIILVYCRPAWYKKTLGNSRPVSQADPPEAR